MRHPLNSDKGDVEISVELLPKDISLKGEYKAAAGEEAFLPEKNSASELLSPPNRPDSSFPWYRLDLQLLWRCKYCWKKSRKWVICAIISAILFIVLIAVVKHYTIG